MEDIIIIGVISDTHDVLSESAKRSLRGVARIIHAGDMGSRAIRDELEEIAPVRAVRGNCDSRFWGDELPRFQVLEVAGYSLFITHDMGEGTPRNLPAESSVRWKLCNSRVAIFGHIHRPVNQEKDGVLYFNPGSATLPRGGYLPSIGLLHFSPEGVYGEHLFF